MLSSGSGDHLCSPPAVLLWRWLFTVLVYWGLVSLPLPLSLGQGQWSISWPLAVSGLCWLAVCFSILQTRLTLGVAHWLRRWAFWLATCPTSSSGLSPAHYWPSCLPSSLFTDSSWGDQLHTPTPSPLRFQCSLPCVLLFSSLFMFSLFFFLWGGSVCTEGYAGLSQGWLGEYCVTLGTYLFVLPNVYQAGLKLVAGGSSSPPVF
jgi:hypothetical protein